MIDALLNRLQRVRQTGDGHWTALCPAHADRSPSLSIHETRDGRILIHCFAGCAPGEVLSSLGLTFTDLFPERLRAPATEQGFGPMRLREAAEQVLASIDHDLLVAALVLADCMEAGRIERDQLDLLISITGKVSRAKEVSGRCVRVVDSCGKPRAN